MSAYHHPQQHYDDGLEVAHSDAPEWVSTSGGTSNDYELGQKIPIAAVPEPYDQYKEFNNGAAGHNAGAYAAGGPGGPGAVAARPWYRRKLILGIIAALLIVGIALGVGLGVGLSSGGSSPGGDSSEDTQGSGGGGNDNSDDNSGSGNNSSICAGDFCSRILTTSIYSGNLYIFGRSADKKTINFIHHDGTDWQDWEDTGSISDFEIISPPTTQAWVVNASYWRMDVFAVTNDENSVYNTWLSAEEEWPAWEHLGNDMDGPVSTCAVHVSGEPDRLDVWGVDTSSEEIVKTMWRQQSDDDVSDDGFDGVTAEIGQYDPAPEWAPQDPLRQSRPEPAVVCAISAGDSERFHDVIWYDPSEDKAWHSSYTREDNWSTRSDFDGKWLGRPQLHTTNDKRNDGYFFGVKDDNELYHLSWGEDGIFSSNQPESLGGPIYSSAAFYADGNGNMDIVGLGEDGMLQHLHKGSRAANWDSEWENLEVRASSAPIMRAFEDELWIFAVNDDEELVAWTVDPEASSWADSLSEVTNLGGSLSLEY